MPFWKVRPGAAVGHGGQTQKPGTVIALPRRIADEFPHAFDECDAAGTRLPAARPAWEKALETIPTHEHVDILREERARLAATIAELTLAAEEATEDAEAKGKARDAAVASLAALDQRLTNDVAAAKALQDGRLAEEAEADRQRRAAEAPAPVEDVEPVSPPSARRKRDG